MNRLLALVALGATAMAAAAPAGAATLYALRDDARLLTVDTASRKTVADVALTGAPGLLAVAVRPADGKLYGLTAGGEILRIDTATGMATPVSKLDKTVETGARAAISFNPTVDRLRVIGTAGNNYRIHVDTGAVTVDGGLKYAADSALSGTKPVLTAAAYTNSYAGAKATTLHTIDPMLAQFNVQAPPNDGVQQSKGALGIQPGYGIGFAILSDGQGANEGFALAGGHLHSVDLATGRFASQGPVAGLGTNEVLAAAVVR